MKDSQRKAYYAKLKNKPFSKTTVHASVSQMDKANNSWGVLSDIQKRDLIEKSMLDTDTTHVDFFKRFHEGKGIEHDISFDWNGKRKVGTYLNAKYYDTYLTRMVNGTGSMPPRVSSDLLHKLSRNKV